jgi:hypothetical protein
VKQLATIFHPVVSQGSASRAPPAAAPEESGGLGLSTGSCILCHEVAANTMCPGDFEAIFWGKGG